MTSQAEKPLTNPDTPATKEATSSEGVKLGKIKLAFLYVLIGGLAASALLAIIAILVGEFNSALQKAFGTIFTFVVHSLFILGLIWSDKYDAIGRKIIPTTILAAALANIVTTTLGTWEIISDKTAGQAVLFYALLIGSSFIVSGALKLRVNHQATKALLYSTVGAIVAWTLLLTPWVFEVVERFNPLYFRIVGALTILMATLFIVAIIVRGIALSRSDKIRQEHKATPSTSISGGMLAYYITLGSIIGIIWLVGMISFIIHGSEANKAHPSRSVSVIE